MADKGDNELKPGQRYLTPTPGHGDRVFYETLYRQRPDSAMAQEWCLYYGVLSYKEAIRVQEKVNQRKKGGGKSSIASPIKRSSGSAAKIKKKKKKKGVKIVDDAAYDDPDMPVSGGDGIGTAVL